MYNFENVYFLDKLSTYANSSGHSLSSTTANANLLPSDEMRRKLQKCHEQFIKNLTFENVRELSFFLLSEEIIILDEKERILENRQDASDRMLTTLAKRCET